MTQYFYDFCCRSGGANLYAGTLTGDTSEPATTPLITYASGNWVQATGAFTVASGNPLSSGVAVGHWASVYPDGTTGNAVFVGRITARDATTITVSVSVNKMGTAPTNGTGNRTLVVGGAWADPWGAIGLVFVQAGSTLTARINLKNDQTYNITSAKTVVNNTSYTLQGYSNSYGDEGRATIDGGTSGASFMLLRLGDRYCKLQDLTFQNNGATGNASGVSGNATESMAVRCVFAHLRGNGGESFSTGFVECEAFDCNQSNTSGVGGFSLRGGVALNCISHHNGGSNSDGFHNENAALLNVPSVCVQCISHANGSHGFKNVSAVNCDSYDNGGDGYVWTNQFMAYVENSNAIKNDGYGFNFGAGVVGDYTCLRYGAGTQANTSGGLNVAATAGVSETPPVSAAYPSNVHPWADPDNGDFRIVLDEAMGTGRGEFTQEYVGFSDVTTMYPDIGAVWHKTGMRMPKRMEGGF